MGHQSDMRGELAGISILEVFSTIIKKRLSQCSVRSKVNGFSKSIHIKKNRIIHVTSENPDDSFYNYLSTGSAVREPDMKKACPRGEVKGLELRRALIEHDLLTYEQLWSLVQEYQQHLLSGFSAEFTGTWEIDEETDELNENIKLDIPIEKFLLEQIRNGSAGKNAHKKFEMIEEVFFKNSQRQLPDSILPYEKHVLELCMKYRNLDRVVEKSELKNEDTLKYVYFFYLIDVLSTEKISEPPERQAKDHLSANIFFSSYEEALKHYNLKFEMIFKILSKEIGPVAASILSKSIDDIRENLPVYLKGAEIDKNGSLIDRKILKKVWYHDYETHSSEFVRGLEELLYAQIYAVKKNLGLDYENQILKWLNGTGIQK